MVFNARHEMRDICLALKSETEDENKGENEGKDDLQNQKEAARVSHAMWEYGNNDNSEHLRSICCIPGGCSYYSHFTDEKLRHGAVK